MSDVAPYGTLGNADAAAITANELVGERAGNVTAHQDDDRFSPARSSTAPYIPPPTPTLCGFKNCRQITPAGSLYCERHQL